MDTLACDLLVKTFKELNPISLCRLSQVSKAFRVPADADEVWLVCHGFRKRLTESCVLYELERMESGRQNAERCRDIVANASATVALHYATAREASASVNAATWRLTERFSTAHIRDLHMRRSVAYTNSDMYIEGLLTVDWEIARNTLNNAMRDIRMANDALDNVMVDLRDAEYFEWSAETDVSMLRYSLGVPLRLRTWLGIENEWRAALRTWMENDIPENFAEVHRLGVLLSFELGILDHQLIY